MIMTSDFEPRQMKPDAFVNFPTGFSYSYAEARNIGRASQITYKLNIVKI